MTHYNLIVIHYSQKSNLRSQIANSEPLIRTLHLEMAGVLGYNCQHMEILI
jgi:hypothetical protein